MSEKKLKKTPPKLIYALRLRCPLCGVTKLQADGSWFYFSTGCKQCNYLFEREEGYFSGASWVIGYGFLGIICLLTIGILHFLFPNLTAMQMTLILSAIFLIATFGFFPYSRSLWMWGDLHLHPLEELDHKKYFDHCKK